MYSTLETSAAADSTISLLLRLATAVSQPATPGPPIHLSTTPPSAVPPERERVVALPRLPAAGRGLVELVPLAQAARLLARRREPAGFAVLWDDGPSARRSSIWQVESVEM